MSRKKWIVSKFDKERCAEISEDYGIPPFTALLAVSKGITDDAELEEFFSEETIYMSDPFELPDMDKAVDRIEKAIADEEKIAVFGDYDADGVTSTALLYTYLKKRGANVTYYIPDRIDEGYGMNIDAIDKIKSEGVSLIVTVDNGISAFEEAEKIKELDMSLVVTDHHRAGNEIPDAEAVVDPFRLDFESDSFKEWAGVGVVFKLIEALEGDDADNLLEEYSDFVAIGTIGDVVNLKSENRQFVKSGIQLMNSSQRPGIKALKTVSGMEDKEIDSTSIAFSIVPRINAAGRMGNALTALELLLCEDEEKALEIAEKINMSNSERQKTETDIFAQAQMIVENNEKYKYDRVIVIDGEDWHSGVIGIVASRMVEKYSKPCLVISKQNGSVAKGSGRSIPGFSLFDALKNCENELTQFGGHTLAAGFEIENDKIESFRKAINEYASECDDVFPVLNIDCKINPKFINLDLLDTVRMMEPFGSGNNQPVFGLYKMYIESVESVSNGKHCKLYVSRDNVHLNVMKFGISPNKLPYRAGDVIDIAATINKNVYLGNVKVSIVAKDIKFSAMDDDKVINSLLLYEKIKRDEKLDGREAVTALPTRDIVVRVYKMLKNFGLWHWDEETLDYRIGDDGERLCAVKIALDALEELELIERDSNENMITLINTDKKTDLDNAEILKKIKSQI